jgi:large subunit ribosomal protein L10
VPQGISCKTPAEEGVFFILRLLQTSLSSQRGLFTFLDVGVFILFKGGVPKFMAKVELKQPIVDEIAKSIEGAQSVVLVNYSGLTVEQDTIMRKELREAGITYKVFKNTMMRRAFEGTPCESLNEHLNGTNALAVSLTDATAPARILAKYAKQYPALELVAGVVEGKYNDQAGIKALSEVPSREELLAKLFGSMQAPIANFARVIKQIAEKDGEAPAAAPAEEAPAAE